MLRCIFLLAALYKRFCGEWLVYVEISRVVPNGIHLSEKSTSATKVAIHGTAKNAFVVSGW